MRDLDEETINQLIPNVVHLNNDKILEAQLNYFSCGGAAIAVSISQVADGFSMIHFVNHWATLGRDGSSLPMNPSFVSSPMSSNLPDFNVGVKTTSERKFVERRFLFPNSKLSNLKNKINEMGQLNPTRVESLSSLLFKCAVRAARTKSGSLQPSNLNLVVYMRDKVSTICSKSALGNIFTVATAKMANSGDIMLNEVITSLRKQRMEIQGVREVEEVGKDLLKKLSTTLDQNHRTYTCSSVCRFPYYQVDFGWGNPVRVIFVTTTNTNWDSCTFLLMDSASGDGIEATVKLEQEEMVIFLSDEELLTYM